MGAVGSIGWHARRARRQLRLRRAGDLPLPPVEMRELVGPTDDAAFDNSSGDPVLGELVPEDRYRKVFDFGCGCGRLARQLLQQRRRPRRYVGIDLHRGMIRWCKTQLEPVAPGFEFHHHDVHNLGLNPRGEHSLWAPFPAADDSFSLVLAHSVFTHLVEEQASPYLNEVARVLEPGGTFAATWFFCDRNDYPMMQSFQNALYINPVDPTNAVIFDRGWVVESARELGLTVTGVTAPAIRGFHWQVLMTLDSRAEEAPFPGDEAPVGSLPPPVPGAGAEEIGLS